jgi:hypothetical protein
MDELETKEIKKKFSFREYLVQVYIACIILFLLGVAGSLILFFIIYKAESIIKLVDSFFIVFMAIFGIASFQIINNNGLFDLFNYSMANLISVFVYRNEKKYIDAIDYKDQRKEKRTKNKYNFVAYYCVSIFFLVAALITYLLYLNGVKI